MSDNVIMRRKGSFIEDDLGMNEEDVLQLVWKIKDPKKGVPVKDRKKTLKTYKSCFLGKDLVDWLIANGNALNRVEAQRISRELFSRKVFQSVSDKLAHFFRDDSSAFYRFVETEEAPKEDGPTRVRFRICVLGSERCGKSSVCSKFSKGEFPEEYKPTSAEEYFRKENYKFPSLDEEVNVEILDTGSILSDEFESKLGQWNDWAHGFMLMYNITSRASFESIPKLFNSLIKTRQFRMTPILVVATKGDMEDERKVSKDEGASLANRYRCKFIEISAKKGNGVNEAFDLMVDTVKRVQAVAGPVKHKTGWVKMRMGSNKTYKKRFMIMTQSGLRYYSQEPNSPSNTSCLKGIIPMHNCIMETFNILSQERRRHSDPNIHKNGKTLTNSASSSSIGGSPTDRKSGDSDGAENSKNSFDLQSSGSSNSSPASKRLDRHGSFGNINLHKEKLKIYIIDNTESEYELMLPNPEERDEWFNALQECVSRANQVDKPRSESVDTESSQEKDNNNNANNGTMTEEEVYSQTAVRFNKSPKKGISFLLGSGIIENTPVAVAKYLASQAKVLKKTAIGEYLGEGDSFNQEVLKEYLEALDFSTVEFDEALRAFLSHFTIPGEAQKIDRIMEKFAGRFCKCNPTVFQNPDVGYILAFSLIMLNTDSHNQNIKPENKMTKAQFVHNNRGIDNGTDLPKDYLERLYDRIVQKEIQMEHERDDFSQWDKQGWIYVKENKTKGSTLNKKNVGKKLFCIISACCLYIFENPADKKPQHIIPLGNLQIDSLFDEKDDKENSASGFLLYHLDPKDSIKSAVEGKEVHIKELQFICDNRKAKMEWMLTFKLNLVSAPNYK